MRLEARKYLMTSTKLQIPACLWFLSGAGATGNTVTGGAKPCSSTSASCGHMVDRTHRLGVEPQFWTNLQTQFDFATAEQRAGAAVRDSHDRRGQVRE